MIRAILIALAVAIDGLWLALIATAGGATNTGLSLAALPALLTIGIVVLALRVPAPDDSEIGRKGGAPDNMRAVWVRYAAVAAVFALGAISIWLYLAILGRLVTPGHVLAIAFGITATIGGLVAAFLAGRAK